MSGVVIVGLAASGTGGWAQNNEGMVPTQALVTVEAKSQPPAGASEVNVEVDGHKTALKAWTPVGPGQAQIAVLIDDGLRQSIGANLDTLRSFVNRLPTNVEVLIGYMQNGRVLQSQPFTTDHAAAANAIRIPQGVPGESASPYFCLSDFVKNWPGEAGDTRAPGTIQRGAPVQGTGKARFVLMISNGVDPYNGSTSLMNQNSPYVQAAATDAQRAGVAVYSIYYSDAGMRGPSASVSGQDYLGQVAEATGGRLYYEGFGNPVNLDPFLKQFMSAVRRSYVATFDAPMRGRELVRLKVTSTEKAKLHAPQQVQPGNVE